MKNFSVFPYFLKVSILALFITLSLIFSSSFLHKKADAYAASGCVNVYEHTYYGGSSQSFCEGEYRSANLSGFTGNISSIEVSSGTKATLYAYGNLNGDFISFTTSQIDLGTVPAPSLCGAWWNDCALSLKVEPVSPTPGINCVTVFEHTYYVGNYREFCLGSVYDGDILDSFKNTISSLKIGKGVQVTLFSREDLNGYFKTFDSDTIDLNTVYGPITECIGYWNDCSESLKIEPYTAGEQKIYSDVLVLGIDPTLSSGQKLHEKYLWNDPTNLSYQLRDWFKQNTFEKVNYNLADIQIYNGFPRYTDGFLYNETTYHDCWVNKNCHDTSFKGDYQWYIDTFNVCNRVNSGEIDEVWLVAGPLAGLYESRLAGPNGYWYNSPPLNGTTCNKLVPIMGFNYERGLDMMVHDYFHRTESSMIKVYGSWNQNSIATSWDKFGLVAYQSPDYDVSGCGSGHYPPNGLSDYDYGNAYNYEYTYCDAFYKFPNVNDVLWEPRKYVNCTEWGCNDLGYSAYWFGHMPKAAGVNLEGKLNDW